MVYDFHSSSFLQKVSCLMPKFVPGIKVATKRVLPKLVRGLRSNCTRDVFSHVMY